MSGEKYIIVEERGYPVAILFDSLISHSEFLKCFHKSRIISAGFFTVGVTSKVKESVLVVQSTTVQVFGESISLKLQSSEEDRNLIKKVLTNSER